VGRGGGARNRSNSSYLLSSSFFYLSFSTLRRDCTSRWEIIKRVMRLTISGLAIQGVHVENDIVDAVHGIDGGGLVAVTDGVG